MPSEPFAGKKAKNVFTEELGPLPVWGWGIVALGTVFLYKRIIHPNAKAAAGTDAAALAASGGAPLYYTPRSGGGGGSGGGGSTSVPTPPVATVPPVTPPPGRPPTTAPPPPPPPQQFPPPTYHAPPPPWPEPTQWLAGPGNTTPPGGSTDLWVNPNSPYPVAGATTNPRPQPVTNGWVG